MSSAAAENQDWKSGSQEEHGYRDWVGLVLAICAAISAYNVAVSSERIVMGGFQALFGDINVGSPAAWVDVSLVVFSFGVAWLGIWLFKKNLESDVRGGIDRNVPFLTLLSGSAQALSFRTPTKWWRLCRLAFAVLFVFVPVHWVASVVSAIFTGEAQHGHATWRDGLTVIGCFLSFLFCSYLLKRNLNHNATMGSSNDEAPYEALMLFLSDPIFRGIPIEIEDRIREFREKLQELGRHPERDRWVGVDGYSLLRDKWGEALGKNNWLMPTLSVLRQVQLGQLSHVFLLCSRESAKFAPDFEKWIKTNLSADQRSLTFHKIPAAGGINFGASAALEEAVDKCYDQVAKLNINSVLLDVTGGTKECSIIGAIRSLPVGRAIVYVSTNDYAIKQYHPAIEQHISDAAGH